MKIQANELRVGNWYNSTKFNRPVMCELSDLSELYRRCDGGPCDESIIAGMFEPLVLTKEWLIGFLFKQWGDKYTWSVKGLIIHHRKRGFVVRKSMPIVEFVHQLQDLYRSLERKELEIKQP